MVVDKIIKKIFRKINPINIAIYQLFNIQMRIALRLVSYVDRSPLPTLNISSWNNPCGSLSINIIKESSGLNGKNFHNIVVQS
jgi:hypothetical protein